MKMMTIEPVAKPKSFKDLKFNEVDWKKATKIGPLSLPAGTAMENVKLSKGLYRFTAAAPEVTLKTEVNPDEMSNQQLAQVMTSFGKPPQKIMTRSKSVAFVRDLLDKAAEMIVDDEDE